jgi:hypothetical protein
MRENVDALDGVLEPLNAVEGGILKCTKNSLINLSLQDGVKKIFSIYLISSSRWVKRLLM